MKSSVKRPPSFIAVKLVSASQKGLQRPGVTFRHAFCVYSQKAVDEGQIVGCYEDKKGERHQAVYLIENENQLRTEIFPDAKIVYKGPVRWLGVSRQWMKETGIVPPLYCPIEPEDTTTSL